MGRNAAIAVFIGLGVWVWGTVFAMLHWPFAAVLRNAGWIVSTAGTVLFIITAIRNKGLTGLMDPSRQNDEGGQPPPSI